ncbi:MAG TPA: hypothetical protein VK824_04985 [Planctomycetota bacterium]|nr:hypothetical protein [Planctomycetota bacterium]
MKLPRVLSASCACLLPLLPAAAQSQDMELAVARALGPIPAQAEPLCGTVATPEMAAEVGRRIRDGVYAAGGAWSATFTGTVPIAFHVVRNSSGFGGYAGDTWSLINSVNQAFAGSGLSFCEMGTIDFINSTLLMTIDSQAEADQLRALSVVPHAINVYFVDDMFITGFQLAGLSSYTFSPVQGVIIDKDFTPIAGAPSTWPHEVGHYFDLFHTDEIFLAPPECTSGANCAAAGDLVCDTPADPSLVGLVQPAPACGYTGGFMAGPCSGDGPYVPDVRNFLGFAPQNCRDHFTPGQKARAYATFINLRPELQLGGCFHDPVALTAFVPAANDHFGSALDVAECFGLNASSLVVGAKDADPRGAGSGEAFVFESFGTGWYQDETLIPATLGAGEALGSSVAFDGYSAFVGAPGWSANRGAVYVFERQGQYWGERQKLTLAAPVAGDRFGTSVDVHGAWGVVGASHDDTGAGSATVYHRDGTTGLWSEVVKLVSSDTFQTGEFGCSVSISGKRVAVGAHLAVGTAGTSGAVFVFDEAGGAWTQTARLVPPTLQMLDDFGASVSLFADTLLAGAPLDDNPGPDAGSAHVFVRVNGIWQYREQLSALDAFAGDRYGSSVALAGNTAVVGAPGANALGNDSGAAYRLSRTTGGWVQDEKIAPAELVAGDAFGGAVAAEHRVDLLADDYAVGASFHDAPQADAGFVKAYQAVSDLPGLSLTASIPTISVATGGKQILSCDATPAQAGKPYMVLGTFSGTSPGQVFGPSQLVPEVVFASPHQSFTLPLNLDQYFNFTLLHPGAPIFNSIGFLDANGRASATFKVNTGIAIPPVGTVVQHAVILVEDPFFSSRTAVLTIVP